MTHSRKGLFKKESAIFTPVPVDLAYIFDVAKQEFSDAYKKYNKMGKLYVYLNRKSICTPEEIRDHLLSLDLYSFLKYLELNWRINISFYNHDNTRDYIMFDDLSAVAKMKSYFDYIAKL